MIPNDKFPVLFLRRLRLALPMTPRFCRCGGVLDALGDHCSACAQFGVPEHRARPLERAATHICRETGARVDTSVALKDLNLDSKSQGKHVERALQRPRHRASNPIMFGCGGRRLLRGSRGSHPRLALMWKPCARRVCAANCWGRVHSAGVAATLLACHFGSPQIFVLTCTNCPHKSCNKNARKKNRASFFSTTSCMWVTTIQRVQKQTELDIPRIFRGLLAPSHVLQQVVPPKFGMCCGHRMLTQHFFCSDFCGCTAFWSPELPPPSAATPSVASG